MQPCSSPLDPTSFASPFDDFFQKYVPQDHEKALRNSFIQALALIFVGGILCGLYYVYSILEPFCVPLFWALLTGIVLHPYKRQMTNGLRQSLERLARSERTMMVALCASTFSKIDGGTQVIAEQFLRFWKVFLAAGMLLPITYTIYYWFPETASQAFDLVQEILLVDFSLLLNTVEIHHIAVCAIITIVSVIFGGEEYRQFYQLTSLVSWLLLGLYLMNFLWPPLVYLIVMLHIYGYCSQTTSEDEPDGPRRKIRSVAISFLQQCGILSSSHESEISQQKIEEDATDGAKNEPDSNKPIIVSPEASLSGTKAAGDVSVIKTDAAPKENLSTIKEITPKVGFTIQGPLESTPKLSVIQHKGVAALKKEHGVLSGSLGGYKDRSNLSVIDHRHHSTVGGNTPRSRMMGRSYYARTRMERRTSITELRNTSMSYIYGAAWACGVLQLWLRPTLAHLLPIPLAYHFVKWVLISTGLAAFFREKLVLLRDALIAWVEVKKDLLFPPPIIFVARVSYTVERKVLGAFIQHTDSIITALMILGMVLGVTMVTIFITFQVYAESLYVVQSVGKVASTLNVNDSYIFVQLNHSLLGSGYDSMENVMDGAYTFGRDWISSTLHQTLAEADSEVRKDLETKLLELWDRSYQYWVHTSVVSELDSRHGPLVSKEAISSSVGEVLEKLFSSQIHADIFNYTAIQTFVKENMGTLTSIMETSWTLFKGNIGFLFDAILGVIRIFFHGGTGVVNFVFGIVIYLTAVFYLLSNSGNTYIPMDLATQYTRFQITGVGSSIQKAVNSVFLITIKMSSFYLLWTYITHVVFQASIVVLPLLFSSFIAACPFTGQHIVALPAALELWLLQERPLAALFLVLLQVAPSWLVDAAIYSEIKGGIHPWFTGLAVVGGVYVFGVLGAIYGPLALCVLYVVINVYTTFMADTEPETTDVRQGSGVTMRERTPLLRSGTVM